MSQKGKAEAVEVKLSKHRSSNTYGFDPESRLDDEEDDVYYKIEFPSREEIIEHTKYDDNYDDLLKRRNQIEELINSLKGWPESISRPMEFKVKKDQKLTTFSGWMYDNNKAHYFVYKGYVQEEYINGVKHTIMHGPGCKYRTDGVLEEGNFYKDWLNGHGRALYK